MSVKWISALRIPLVLSITPKGHHGGDAYRKVGPGCVPPFDINKRLGLRNNVWYGFALLENAEPSFSHERQVIGKNGANINTSFCCQQDAIMRQLAPSVSQQAQVFRLLRRDRSHLFELHETVSSTPTNRRSILVFAVKSSMHGEHVAHS